jgi:UDP-N-acetylmuramate dehydrogenase
MATRQAWDELLETLDSLRGASVRPEEPMSRHTTLGVGGRARVLVTPATVAQVSAVICATRALGIARVAVGKGSNLIVRDGGYDGVVIKLGSNLIVRDGGYDGVVIKLGTQMSKVTVNRKTVRAEAGASFARLCRSLTRAGRRGLEFGVGIPGTVGGAVRMNAGAFGGEVSDVLRRAWVVEGDGAVRRLEAAEIEFGYRRTDIARDAVVVEATFSCPPGEVDREAYERALRRKETQPIDERTFGSTFVNPPGGYAAAMIEGCGLKGKRIGGATISDRHANFIVNPEGKARAADVEALIDLMKRKVKERYGVSLETEVVIIGSH